MQRVQFGNGNFYHIYNRGVDRRNVFLDSKDFDRFLQSMEVFNTVEPLGGFYIRALLEGGFQKHLTRRPTSSGKLVRVICYCLNPNHFHLILEQLVGGGISEFMKRLGGYTKYVNNKYKRSGALFQGKFKYAYIDSNKYLLHASAYVNLNDRVHQLKHTEFQSSWSEYAGLKRDGFCHIKIVLDQFRDFTEYEKFARDSLEDILERKQLKKELGVLLLE